MLKGQFSSRQVFAERSAFHVVHGVEGKARFLAHVVDRHHTRMLQRGRGLSLAHEALPVLLRRVSPGEQDLESDPTPGPLLPRLVHHAHPAPAKDLSNLIARDFRKPIGLRGSRLQRCDIRLLRPRPGVGPLTGDLKFRDLLPGKRPLFNQPFNLGLFRRNRLQLLAQFLSLLRRQIPRLNGQVAQQQCLVR